MIFSRIYIFILMFLVQRQLFCCDLPVISLDIVARCRMQIWKILSNVSQLCIIGSEDTKHTGYKIQPFLFMTFLLDGCKMWHRKFPIIFNLAIIRMFSIIWNYLTLASSHLLQLVVQKRRFWHLDLLLYCLPWLVRDVNYWGHFHFSVLWHRYWRH